MKPTTRTLATLLALLVTTPCLGANTGYRCTDANGRVSFQDRPCAREERSTSFQYERNAATPVDAGTALNSASAGATPPDASATSGPVDPPPVPVSVPRPPVPTLFKCVRADNDKVYYSETGETTPYRVPAGVLGVPPTALADSAQLSAPELNATPVAEPGNTTDIAAALIEVRDSCERLSPAETCRALRGQLDDNLSRQRGASKDERAGFANEARILADKLAGC